MKKKNISNKGFTLVELSIVLVIIGLLIGGILVAQSLIDSTKIQSLARNISQYDAAIGSFTDRFRQFPGDSSVYPTSVGNGNNLLDSTNNTANYSTEMAQFWYELSRSGLKNEDGGDYDNDTSSGITAGTHIPKSPVGSESTGIMALGGTGALGTLDITSGGNMYAIANCNNPTNANATCIGGMTGADGLAVDTKLDDGDGLTGNVANIDDTTSAPGDWWSIINTTEEAYDPTDDALTASIIVIRMGSTTGTPY